MGKTPHPSRRIIGAIGGFRQFAWQGGALMLEVAAGHRYGPLQLPGFPGKSFGLKDKQELLACA
jgi:hypothetical protein